MIIGSGSDLIDIRRIAQTLDRFGDRFIHRCFTAEEIAKAEKRRPGGRHVDTYAKRFAAKEAMSKALGTGFSQGVFMRDIGVVNDDWGRPTLECRGGAQARLEALMPAKKKAALHLTLTDEPPLASSFVMIEAVEKDKT
jgi:holo-[acyl-carrier protein] synthase